MDNDSVTVTVDGVERDFTKFERHMLYCIEEGRHPSTRLYDGFKIVAGFKYFVSIGYAVAEDHTTCGYVLTELGYKAITALRERAR